MDPSSQRVAAGYLRTQERGGADCAPADAWRTVAHVLARWYAGPGMQDIKISRIAATAGTIHHSRPSLVQPIDTPSN
jgi:hypothetical protein